jgi:MFS family permease
MSEQRSVKRSLGAGYWKLWSASVITNLGDGMSAVAYPWLASAVTRDPVHIALIGVATRLPWLLFSLPAGVITDRVDRRRLIAVMDWLRAALTLAVAVAVLLGQSVIPDPVEVAVGTADPPAVAGLYLALLYISALLLGAAEVLRDNSAQTLMPALVDAEDLEKANGRLWGAEMVSNSFVGTPLGGILAGIALSLPFFVDAASFAIAAGLVFAIGGSFRAGGAETRAGMRVELMEGLRWLWRHLLLRNLAIFLGLANALSTMAFATYVLFAQESLGLDAGGFGVVLTGAAVGGIAGSLAASRLSRLLGPGASLFLTLGGSALGYVLVAVTDQAWVVWLIMAVTTFLAMVWNVITVSLRQEIIPDRLLGRVNSVYRFFGWGMMPLGGAAGGAVVWLAEVLGWGRDAALRAPFWVAAAGYAILFVVALPRLGTDKIESARQSAAELSS